jgi:hypothetical protein
MGAKNCKSSLEIPPEETGETLEELQPEDRSV